MGLNFGVTYFVGQPALPISSLTPSKSASTHVCLLKSMISAAQPLPRCGQSSTTTLSDGVLPSGGVVGGVVGGGVFGVWGGAFGCGSPLVCVGGVTGGLSPERNWSPIRRI